MLLPWEQPPNTIWGFGWGDGGMHRTHNGGGVFSDVDVRPMTVGRFAHQPLCNLVGATLILLEYDTTFRCVDRLQRF